MLKQTLTFFIVVVIGACSAQFPRSPEGPGVCRLPSDRYGVIESFLSGPAMIYHTQGMVPAGTVIKVSCRPGYIMASNEPHESLCTDDGTWSHTIGRCKPIACVMPTWFDSAKLPVMIDLDQSSIPFPGTKRLYRVGSHVHFICVDKEELTFPSDIYCLQNGHWNVRPPKQCSRSYYHWDEVGRSKKMSSKELPFFG